MSIEDTLNKGIDRREFLKGSGKAAVGLAGLVSGCAPTLKETRQDVANQKWDVNPIIPIPLSGCYVGSDLIVAYVSRNKSWERKAVIDLWKKKSGKRPAIDNMGTGYYSAWNDFFPLEECQAAIQSGVIPLIKYVVKPFGGYNEIVEGKWDTQLTKFAAKAREFQHPLFFDPFPEINFSKAWETIVWGGQPGHSAKKALRHMHNIFKSEGVNNTVWIMQYVPEKNPLWIHPEEFYPGDFISWIGFTVRSRACCEGVWPMDSLFNFSYEWARKNHRTKPIMLVELGAEYNDDQPKWVMNAYEMIKTKYPAVKAVLYSERCVDEFHEDCWLRAEGQAALRQALSDPYFIDKVPPKE
jgi:hypothetical protein